jgi:hypothetical protein
MTRAHLPIVDRARGQHRALAVALAILLVPLIVGSASATPPGNRPAVTVTPTVSGTSVSIRADVNRGTGDLASCNYVIGTSKAVSCGVTPSSDGKKASDYTFTLLNQAEGTHIITVTVGLKDGGSASGSASFTITAPRMFAVAFTDTNDNHTYEAATDHLIAALIDSNRDGTPNAGDTVVADEFPLTVDPVSAWGQFVLKSDTVTHVAILDGAVFADSATGSYSWEFAVDIELFDSVPLSLGFVSQIEDNGNPSFGTDDNVFIFPNSPLDPSPDTVSSSVHDTADNEFIDITTDLP